MTASFSCPQCQAVFSRSAHLRRHQRTHRTEKPYVCQFCSVASSRKDVIVRHTRNFHPDAVRHDSQENHFQDPSTQTTKPVQQRDSASSSPVSDSGNASPQLSQHQNEDQNQDQDRESQIQIDNPCGGQNQDQALILNLDQQEQLRDLHLPSAEMDQTSLVDFHMFDFPIDDFTGTPLATLPPVPSDLLVDPFHCSPPSPRSLLDSLLINQPPDAPSLNTALSPACVRLTSTSKDADYTSARTNLDLYYPTPPLNFPPKHAVYRFVNAFFNHMAPHVPIIHQPTFSIASAATPLLLEILACGALYLCERTTAVTLHAGAQQLMFKIERGSESHGCDQKFELWTLQTYLLMSYFGAYGGNLATQQRATHIFPFAIKLAQDALHELDSMTPASTYTDWVYQETISRSIAITVEIGAALASTAREQCFTAPFFDMPFPLPCNASIWQQDELYWQGSPPQLDSCQVVSCLFAGQKPVSSISDLGIITVVSMLLWRICSFEALAGSYRLEMCVDIVNKTDRAVHILDAILKDQLKVDEICHATLDPLFYTARALLNSIFYHLYASEPLAEMKNLLDSPRKRKSSLHNNMLAARDHSSQLGSALVRGAEALQSDCRMGINYVQRMAPHHIGPICANASYEGSLLLCWYLNTKPTLFSAPELIVTLDRIIDDVSSEMGNEQVTNHSQNLTLPLKVTAELLSDRSVWQFPSAVSQKLKTLTQSSLLMPL